MHNKSTSFQIMFVSISKQNFNSFLKRLTFDKINMFLIHKNEWETDLSNLFLSHKIGFHNAKISKKLPIDPYIKKNKGYSLKTKRDLNQQIFIFSTVISFNVYIYKTPKGTKKKERNITNKKTLLTGYARLYYFQ